jgi:hypothetical protein
MCGYCFIVYRVNSGSLITYRKVFIFAGDVFLKAEVAELGKGARLRALFRRDPWVQIPSSAPDMMFFGEQSLNIASLTMGISGLDATSEDTCNPFLQGLLSVERNKTSRRN